ncbi:uncharacterized protein LOC133533960 [Cydia pomonella]|uniref:uncharacterized protein LOC133533960 n=1 Tax=Cydia pomonella TaxID=82600 RepID=UPI002ADD9C44|nr:uncharacterized protein LOC133533960 [Cydia pomonella]
MSVGKIKAFEVASYNWTMYIERLEMYFQANDIKADVQLPTLIAVMGAEAYELLRNLTSPKKPGVLEYSEVIKIMQEHVEPKPSFMAERYRFRLRRQGEDETVAQYLTELKRLSKHCEFESSLEDNLRDQLTCGLKNDTIKQRLFAEKNLTYLKAVSLAFSLEAAERDAATVERPCASESNVARSDMASVNSITPGPRGGNRGNNPNNRQNKSASTSNMPNNGSKCAVCGREGHREAGCRYRNATCSKCGCRGHLRRVCPSWEAASGQGAAGGRSSGAGTRGAGAGGRGSRRAFHHVQAAQYETPGADEGNSSETEFEESLHHLCLNDYSAV